MPERSTLRGAVSSFHVDSALLTGLERLAGDELAVALAGLHLVFLDDRPSRRASQRVARQAA